MFFNYLFNFTYHSVSISKRVNVCQANKFTKTIKSAKLVIKICVFFINFTNRQFWATRQFHWHKIRRWRKKKWRKRGRAKACPVPRHGIPPPQPSSFLPARAFSFGSVARSAAINRSFVQNEF